MGISAKFNCMKPRSFQLANTLSALSRITVVSVPACDYSLCIQQRLALSARSITIDSGPILLMSRNSLKVIAYIILLCFGGSVLFSRRTHRKLRGSHLWAGVVLCITGLVCYSRLTCVPHLTLACCQVTRSHFKNRAGAIGFATDAASRPPAYQVTARLTSAACRGLQ